MALSVTVLGCDGSFPGPGGASTGFLVRGGGLNVWLDCGSGTMAALQTHIGLHEVDAVIVTHEHPDHRSDLEGFHVACRWVHHLEGILVLAPPGVRGAGYHTGPPTLVFEDVHDGSVVHLAGKAGGGPAREAGLRCTFSQTDHPVETLAVRVEEPGGRCIVFSSDTGPDWHVSSLGGPGRPIDLAVIEATYTCDGEATPGHLSGRLAGAMAREAGVGRLMVTHQWPTVDREEVRREAEGAFEGPVVLAIAGATHEA